MFGTMIRRGLVVGTLVGTVIVSAGPAGASVQPHRVISDLVGYSGTEDPSTGLFRSTSCVLTSHGDTKPFRCHVSGQLLPSPSGSAMMAAISSADGLTAFSAPLTQGKGGSFSGTGDGTEYDAPGHRGAPVPPPSPCTVSLAAGNTSGGTITGTFTVKELSQ